MVKSIYNKPLLLGESPIWDERTQTLLFVDILNKKLYSYQSDHGVTEQYDFSEYISCVALHRDKEKIVIALESGVYYYHLAKKRLTFIVQPEKKENYRFNDGIVDKDGNWLLGSMNNINNGSGATYLPDASLYLIHNTQYRVLRDGVTISNGIAFHEDSLYYVDSIHKNVQQFIYQNGDIKKEREFIKITGKGTPDGMTLSQNGKLYIALWGGRKIVIIDILKEKITGSIELPCLNPTSCTFGGKNMNELFITSASLGDSSSNLSGLYSITLEDKGTIENKLSWD